MPMNITQLSIWKDLLEHAADMRKTNLGKLFQEDNARGEAYCTTGAGLTLDSSKNLINGHTLRLLFELAEERFLPKQRTALFDGQIVNISEHRAALHTALRAIPGESIFCNGHAVMPDVEAVLSKMYGFADAIWSGEKRGATGKPIRNVINVGIGGSYLGPQMAYQALRNYRNTQFTVHFLANIDGAEFEDVTSGLDPAETLFIIASKTFTTLETMTNARRARQWVVNALGETSVAHHFVAVSTNHDAVTSFGISEVQTFGFWDWVGGRYSMDSAIGLSTLIAIGGTHFRHMLQGFHEMDLHFLTAPPAENLPLIHGLIAIWNNNFLNAETLAILPYAHDLRRFPAYLQQLFMESNGKRVDNSGDVVTVNTCPIVWGEPGTDGQHSFYQLLHQGTRFVACDFIGFHQSLSPLTQHHDILMASLFAQCEALAFGKDAEALTAEGVLEQQVPHRVCPGNRPSNIILAESLTPMSLGTLIAFYEHSVFVQGALWNIDSFDQWGVELGKHLAQRIIEDMSRQDVGQTSHDSSTTAELRSYLHKP